MKETEQGLAEEGGRENMGEPETPRRGAASGERGSGPPSSDPAAALHARETLLCGHVRESKSGRSRNEGVIWSGECGNSGPVIWG